VGQHQTRWRFLALASLRDQQQQGLPAQTRLVAAEMSRPDTPHALFDRA
jgi:hypothetical protein